MNKLQLIGICFTNKCNFDCRFCRAKTWGKNYPILRLKDFKEFDSILNGTKSVDITGYGEFATHPDFYEIINKITKSEVFYSYVTNGYLINKEKADFINNSLINLMVISINSLNPSTYKYLSGGIGDLNVLLNNVDYIATTKKFGLRFSFVINNHNIKELKNFIDFGKKYNCDVIFKQLTPTIKDYDKDLIIDMSTSFRTYLDEVKLYAKENKVNLICFNPNLSRTILNEQELITRIKKCTIPFTTSYIGNDGNVGICCRSSASMGNIKDNTFEEIWNGEKYKDVRRCVREGSLKYCKDCD